METKKLSHNNVLFTILVFAFQLGLLSWQFFNGGVVSHHLLHRADYPAISNWWGLVLLPFLTWFSVYRSELRLAQLTDNQAKARKQLLLDFVIALVYGGAIALCFELGLNQYSSYLFFAIPLIGIFIKVYREVYILGFVLSMSIAFGGVLPVIFALIIALVAGLIYHVCRMVLRLMTKSTAELVS